MHQMLTMAPDGRRPELVDAHQPRLQRDGARGARLCARPPQEATPLNADELHRDAVVNDGLIIANWSRGVCEDMRCGGWNEARIRKAIGENSLAPLDKVWKA